LFLDPSAQPGRFWDLEPAMIATSRAIALLGSTTTCAKTPQLRDDLAISLPLPEGSGR
jgi:hypothetical protein